MNSVFIMLNDFVGLNLHPITCEGLLIVAIGNKQKPRTEKEPCGVKQKTCNYGKRLQNIVNVLKGVVLVLEFSQNTLHAFDMVLEVSCHCDKVLAVFLAHLGELTADHVNARLAFLYAIGHTADCRADVFSN